MENKTVLIVHLRAYTKKFGDIFKKAGWEVTTATTVDEGGRALNEGSTKFDLLVIHDHIMGYDMLDRIGKNEFQRPQHIALLTHKPENHSPDFMSSSFGKAARPDYIVLHDTWKIKKLARLTATL